MEGNRKFLTTLTFGLLSLAALALILLLKQFTPEVFRVWITGTASVFGVYQVANVVSKFSPEVQNGQTQAETPAPKGREKREGLLSRLFRKKGK
jgi:hypothetical protein